jgi:hypothetical protein
MRLNAKRVELIRTSGKPDAYWARIWRVQAATIREARTGKTWRDHPAPPDTAPRAHRGSWGDLPDTSTPEHP